MHCQMENVKRQESFFVEIILPIHYNTKLYFYKEELTTIRNACSRFQRKEA